MTDILGEYPFFDLDAFVAGAYREDLGDAGDITAQACIPADAGLRAEFVAREPMVVAGLPVAKRFFETLDPDVQCRFLVEDGEKVEKGTVLLRIAGNARALLTAERPALNTLQHLSGIATMTRTYVDKIEDTGAVLLDTRKTLPGLRMLEKYAVLMGGGMNHRLGLWDAPMVKDNHVAACGGIEAAVRACKEAGLTDITVEVDLIDQIEPAIRAGADRLLLDNMPPPVLRQAVALVAGRVPTEASGGVRLDTIHAIAETGVDFVSVGRITQSAPAVDIGMDYLD